MSTFGNEALRVFNNHEAQARFWVDLRTPSPRTLNTATPLGLHRPLEKTSKTKYSAVSTLNFDGYFPTLCTENSYPGSYEFLLPLVRRKKSVIDIFQKWLLAFSAYILVIVAVLRGPTIGDIIS